MPRQISHPCYQFLPDSTRHLYNGGQLGFPGSVPQRKGLEVSEIRRGSPTGQMLERLLPLLPEKYGYLVWFVTKVRSLLLCCVKAVHFIVALPEI